MKNSISSKASSIPKSNHRAFRIIIGVIGAVSFAIGSLMYFLQPDADPFLAGMLVRIGALLGVICLAFPELLSLKGRLPAIFFGLALICIVLIAVRPRFSQVFIALLVIGVGLGSVMKWMSNITKDDPRKR